MNTQTTNPAREAGHTLDTFTRAYVTTALWSCLDDQFQPLDANFSRSDIAPKALARIIADCATFQRENAEMLAISGLNEEQSGHDFWLSRYGHGAGFFDRYSGTGNEAVACDALQLLARQCGECDLYVGDDGQLYI